MKSKWLFIIVLAISNSFAAVGRALASTEPSTDSTRISSEAVAQTIDISGQPIEGGPDARVVIVEFFDYQCPACGRQARDILPEIRSNYIDAGVVSYVYMDFPLESIHPLALQAAEAAGCAADQGKFLEMHDLLFSRQNALREDNLYDYADSLLPDISAFQDCMVTNKQAESVANDVALGRSVGARRTPSIFLTVRDAEHPERVTVVKMIEGVTSYSIFSRQVDRVLAEVP